MIPIILLSFVVSPQVSQKHIQIDLKNYAWMAYENNKLIKSGNASGGRRWCPDIKTRCKTPTGIFKVLSKKSRGYRSPLYPVGCNNKDKNNRCAPMPYAVKFKHSGEAIHGHRGRIKFHSSHGCVHVSYEDARWIRDFVNVGDEIKILKY